MQIMVWQGTMGMGLTHIKRFAIGEPSDSSCFTEQSGWEFIHELSLEVYRRVNEGRGSLIPFTSGAVGWVYTEYD